MKLVFHLTYTVMHGNTKLKLRVKNSLYCEMLMKIDWGVGGGGWVGLFKKILTYQC